MAKSPMTFPDLYVKHEKSLKYLAGKCIDCGKNVRDYPSKYCPGCQAYKEHQA